MATITENLQTIQSSLSNIKTAIVAKGVEVNGNITTYADKIASIETGGGGGGTAWTGHADADGLRAIGWTDEDIAYYQANGVNWNEEDDQYHLVSDDNKALYGVLTASNISTYRDRIVYLPKIDTSGMTSMSRIFSNCYSLVFIPLLDTSSVTDMYMMFQSCCSLTSIPLLDTSNVTNMSYMFQSCYSLVSIPLLNTSNVTNMYNMFQNCYSLTSIPQLDTSKVENMSYMFQNCYSLTSIPQLDTSKVENMEQMLVECRSLIAISQLDASEVTNMFWIFNNNASLTHLYINNIGKASPAINKSPLITKESLLYIINNEAATSAITITLHSYAYTRWAEDADVVAALANHPNISLSK